MGSTEVDEMTCLDDMWNFGDRQSHGEGREGPRVTILGRMQPDDVKEVIFIKGDLPLARDAKRLGQSVDVSMVDTILFTNGITDSPQRKASGEGIEIAMAVNTLSRYTPSWTGS
ncbi:hypothetical protein BC830DRAFT_1174438 [Chytriomyces sp. MP71]|nr:hypothetical protein BC830DRAFT_1174438 [Chytriomyces sp. MP71]